MKTYQYFCLALTFVSVLVLNGCGGGGGGGASTATPSDLAQIQTQMDRFANLFSAGLPTETAVSAELAPNFMMDGMNAAAYAKQLTTSPAPVASGDYFVLTLATLFDNANQSNAVAGTQWVDATQFNAAGTIVGESRVKFVNVGGTWLIAGNERAVQVNLRAESGVATATSAVPATFTSDVNISIDPTTASLSGVASAWVSGPNVVASSPSGVLVYSNPVPAIPTSAALDSQIRLCDSTIVINCTNAVDGSEYTITLNDTSGAVIATYKEAIKKAPLPTSALNAALFPSIGTITPSTIAGVAPGAALSLDWTNPTGLVSNWVDFTVWDSNGQLVFQISGPPSGNMFSGNFPTFILPSGVALSRYEVTVQSADVYGRQYIVFK